MKNILTYRLQSLERLHWRRLASRLLTLDTISIIFSLLEKKPCRSHHLAKAEKIFEWDKPHV